ncbi:MAG: hypothetical protein AAFX78_05575 [Cyanobacteria bacterium J06638_20]
MRSDDSEFLCAWDIEMTGALGLGDRPTVPFIQRTGTRLAKV